MEHSEVSECSNINGKTELSEISECDKVNEKINSMVPLLCKAGSLTEELSVLVIEVTNFMKSQLQRKPMPESNWRVLIQLMKLSYNFILEEQRIAEKWDFVADVLRCVRNSCAGCCRDEDLSISAEDLLQIPIRIITFLFTNRCHTTEQGTVVLRCSLQVIGNVVCQSSNAKEIVWETFTEENLFRTLICDPDVKVKEYTLMITYHCLTPMQGNIMCNLDARDLVITISDYLSRDDFFFDWGWKGPENWLKALIHKTTILCLELVIYERGFMEEWYKALTSKARLLILDIIAEQLECPKSDTPLIPDFVLKAIKISFVKSIGDIVRFNQLHVERENLEAVEIIKHLSLLCIASVNPYTNSILRNFPELVEVSVDTLKSVHLLGKQSSNAFSRLNNSKELSEPMKEEIASHPSFCFKKDLVRLIGNLCANSRENQDVVRDHDGIPLLLDCCNLDYRNPYLLEWCILAIRNVLENNAENQAVLASITIEEKSVNSPFLNELGFTVEMENGRPVLKPKV